MGGGSTAGGVGHAGACSPGGGIPAIGKRDGLLALLVSAAAAGDNGRPLRAGRIPAGGSCESLTREGRTGGTTVPQPRHGNPPASGDSAGCSPGTSGVLMRAPRGERALEESLERYQRRLRGERHRRGARAGRPSRRSGQRARLPPPAERPNGTGWDGRAAGKLLLVLPAADRRRGSCRDLRSSRRPSARAGALPLQVRPWFV